MVSTVGSRSPNCVCKRVKRPDAEGRAWYIRGLDKRAHPGKRAVSIWVTGFLSVGPQQVTLPCISTRAWLWQFLHFRLGKA